MCMRGGVNEGQLHYCYIPGTPGYYVEGDSYRNSVLKHEAKDKGLFYDKIAFWELTSFLGLLKYPELDGAFSVGLYHTAAWTFNSPYCWDPYGIKERISCLIDKMFVLEYEIQYYRNYILSMQNKDSVMLREYLYAAYYALAMEYCIKNNRFAPVYFKTLLSLCRNEELAKAVLKLEEDYYSFDLSEVESGNYERKMMAQRKTVRNDVIDGFLRQIVDQTQNYEGKMPKSGTDYRGKVVEIILDALN